MIARVAGFFVGAFCVSVVVGCDPPPPPPTETGDACSTDERCDSGFFCFDAAGDDNATCQPLPDGCDAIDGCDCPDFDDVCGADAIGKTCVSFASRISVDCTLGAVGEGEGE